MHVEFERSGGFAGLRLRATVDTESLPAEEARELEEMVEAADLFNLPPAIATPTPGADRFNYKLTVTDEGRQHAVEVSEPSVPTKLQPLLQRLAKIARSAS